MCAHLHGGLWNHSKVGSSLGVSGKTVAHYLSILEHAYMLRLLRPCAANVKKRLVKSPRVYLRDSGILHRLLRIDDLDMLAGHPVRGASWEGFVIEQIAAAAPDADLSFYRTSAGAEIDLLVRRGRHLTAVEIKVGSAPRVERGFWNALEDLSPNEAWVVAPVTESFPFGNGVTVAPVDTVCRSLGEDT
jgi:predicted AAA+ superfamily ATPase